VVADIAKLSVGREGYYTRELATDHEQYLSGHGESPGRWYGAGGASLGLEGEASPASFRRMFEGRHPDTGELLGRPHGRNAVPAFDVVLRPTKSVSILYGLGDAATGRAVLAAHHAGVAEATAYLDEHLGTRRGHGGHQHVAGQGLLAVGFDHRTSGRVTRWCTPPGGGQPGPGAGRTLDSLGRPRLVSASAGRGRHLPRLLPARAVPDPRVEWTDADAHGNRELEGMAEALLRAFSERTDQIDREVDRLEASGRERTPRLGG
jgi:TrwC relaxase